MSKKYVNEIPKLPDDHHLAVTHECYNYPSWLDYLDSKSNYHFDKWRDDSNYPGIDDKLKFRWKTDITKEPDLKEDEIKAIGKFGLEEISKKLIYKKGRLLKIKGRKVLNSQSTINWVNEEKYNISVDYGSGILEQSLLEAINCFKETLL